MNKKVLDFSLPDQNGNIFNLYENLDSNVMLVFYPKDNSPVCTAQLCNYNDNLDRFINAGIKVIGINTESVESHKKFVKEFDYKFPVLSDSDKEVSKRFSAINFLGINNRKIVIISPEKELIYEDTILPILFSKADNILDLDFLKRDRT